MADRVAGHPWRETSLGAPAEWDPVLRWAVDLIMACPAGMALVCGHDGLLVYNDAFAGLMGDKHPAGLGQPTAKVFAEMWDITGVGDAILRVYRTGLPYIDAERWLPIERTGDDERAEQALFTRTYSPVRNADGTIVAVLAVVAENTDAIHRLQSLGELTAALATAVTVDDVAQLTMRWAMAAFDIDHVGFAVAVGNGGTFQTVRRVRGDIVGEADERLPPLWRRFPAHSKMPIIQAATEVSALFLTGSDLDSYRSAARDRHDAAIRALAAIPLQATGVRGGLTFGYLHEHTWPAAQRAQLGAAAQLVAQALHRANRFESEHGTSRLLQRSLLPDALPTVDNFRLAARYDPGVDGNAAGGDFYDAFELPDGQLAVVLGDVAGHDLHAAALMGQVRAGLRAFALLDPEPRSVLHNLDRLVATLGTAEHDDERFVTVVYGLADPGRHTLRIATAGHPAPLLRRHHGHRRAATAAFLDIPPGPPIGLNGEHPAVTVTLHPGDTLVLFSDGVVERRTRDITASLGALRAAVAASASGDARHLCALATAAVPGDTDDDVAVLTVERATGPSRTATLTVPAEAVAAPRARRWLNTQLHAWNVEPTIADTAVLCLSELVTNAVLHAGTPAKVTADLNTERLLIAVTDTGTRGVVTRPAPETLSSRGRGIQLIAALADAWGTDPTIRGASVWFEFILPPHNGA